MHTDIVAELRKENTRLRAEVDDLSIDDGFGVPVARKTRRAIDTLAKEHQGRVCVAVGDIAHLKQLNSACGSQERTDNLIRPALVLRADDAMVFGKRDGGDQFIAVWPSDGGPGPCERINERLKDAPMTTAERRTYVRGVCVKRWGPWLGRVVSLFSRQPAHPSIDWQVITDVRPADVLAAASIAERRLFQDKAARLTFGFILRRETPRC
jgi:hypothetical protein